MEEGAQVHLRLCRIPELSLIEQARKVALHPGLAPEPKFQIKEAT